MRALGLVLVLVSVVLVFVALQFVRSQGGSSQATGPTGPEIIVAAAPLNFGDHITAKQLKIVRWPENAVPPGSFTKMDDLVGNSQDRVALRPIEAGEPVLATKVSGDGGRASLSSVIGPNMRAMTIHVNDATGVAGFVLPNDRVDLLLTRTENKGNTAEGKFDPQTEILLQNIKVLGVDQEANEKKDKPTPIVAKAVTLEVSPEDAEKLTLGQQIGTLSLALRNYGTKQEVVTRPFSVSDLSPAKPTKPVIADAAAPGPAEPAPPPPPERAPVTVLRGGAGVAVK
jgi:pilus assembly protein CpaB